MTQTDDPEQMSFGDPYEMRLDDYSPVAQMTLGRIGAADVRRYARRWHYSGDAQNVMWSYALWDGITLVGVVGYNMPTMSVCASIFGPEHWDSVLHMGRLVCADGTPSNVESRLIGLSLRQLHTDKPRSRAVLTYAAPSAGHIGTIYQATNALYLGTGGESYYYRTASGERRATNQGGCRLSRADAVARGWTIHDEPPKHRYIYLLGNRRRRAESLAMLRYPVLPYPKRGCDDIGEEM